MKQLPYRAEKWLFDTSKEAWGAYLHWKYALDRDAVSAVIRQELKNTINEAHKRVNK
jgi:hypothetical protein